MTFYLTGGLSVAGAPRGVPGLCQFLADRQVMGSIRLSDGNTHVLAAIEGWRVREGNLRAGLRFAAVSGGACASPPATSTSLRRGRSGSIPCAPTKPPRSTGSPTRSRPRASPARSFGRRSSSLEPSLIGDDA